MKFKVKTTDLWKVIEPILENPDTLILEGEAVEKEQPNEEIKDLKTIVHFGSDNPTFSDLHNDLIPFENKINELVRVVNRLMEKK